MIHGDDSAVLLEILAEIKKFPKSVRYNTRNESEFKQGMNRPAFCMGSIHSFRQGPRISVATSSPQLQPLLKALLLFMKLYIPSFKFTSIQVNKNFSAGSLHVDNNQGPSIMISVGNFKGGNLYIDGVGERQTRNQFVQFDGNVPHMALDYKGGDRYSFVFFTSTSFIKLPQEQKDELKRIGFPIPSPKRLQDYIASSAPLRKITRAKRVEAARERLPPHIRTQDKGSLPAGARSSVRGNAYYKKLQVTKNP